MLTRLLLLLDVLLVAAAGTLGIHLYQVGTARPAGAAAAPARSAPAAGPAPHSTALAAPAPPAPAGSLAHFGVVAERNLFSPTRSEAPPEPTTPTTAQALAGPAAPRPRLYGVVIGRDQGARAYLEDPKTRKVFAYGVGDSVADSRVEQINADRVTLRRGGETFDVLLRDPAKPKPAAPTAVPGAPPAGRPTVPRFPAVPRVPGAASPEIPQVLVPGPAYDPLVQPTIPGMPVIPGQPPIVPAPANPSVAPARPVVPRRSVTPSTPGTVPTPPLPRPQTPGTP